jgi:class 3 adenylate cyclase
MRETSASGPLLKHRKNASRHQNRSIPLVPRTAWRQPTYWLCGVAKSINQAIRLRIGINLGDIIIEDDGDVIGDGVNVAARLEQIAEPGGVCLSGSVH